ncbi:unnamed protein product [Macrosiphum euphorbiae]|uniref:Uncharacterized protein n=1 Tax=Macrosiphum euphorbiae TaxID=13131 RepID=A0AAV0WZW2_9HEMI|nr:unnamed protein product [Macrosiphum euphorbiae]
MFGGLLILFFRLGPGVVHPFRAALASWSIRMVLLTVNTYSQVVVALIGLVKMSELVVAFVVAAVRRRGGQHCDAVVSTDALD